MPGPPKKPTALRLLEGNLGHQKINRAEPKPALGVPAVGTMPEAARYIWDSVATELDRLGLLSKIDGTALEAACRGAADAQWADSEIQKAQVAISAGNAEQNDYYRIGILNALSKKGWMQWKAFATEFGLTPASRGKLAVSKGQASDPLDDAIFG